MNTQELTEMVMMLADKQAQTPTLRDFFAGQILSGLMAFGHSALNKRGSSGSSSTAFVAYQMADAMLKAREGE